MNYMPQVMNYLSATEDIRELYLVPNAFIMEKREGKLIRVSDAVLSPEDIRDTLVALRSHTPFAPGPIGREGMFSFGVHNVGRFRVSYITQRGSYVVHIIRTPYHIPQLSQLCSDKNTIAQLDELIRLNHAGLVLFTGKNQVRVNTFVYSLLQYICMNYSKVIFVLERPLTFLLKHGQSLVIQREVGVDVENFREGLKDAFYMKPDILFVSYGDVEPVEELWHIIKLLGADTLSLVSFSSLELKIIKKELGELSFYIKAVVEVEEDTEGFKARLLNIPHQAQESH
jgi:twitching motility protein PilT